MIVLTLTPNGRHSSLEVESSEKDIAMGDAKSDWIPDQVGDDSIIKREVVQEKTGADRGKLVPTASGQLISDFLTDHFTPVVDYGFTANVEEEFDQIADGKLERNIMLAEFYTPFHELIEKSGGIDRSTVGQSREVGVDPNLKNQYWHALVVLDQCSNSVHLKIPKTSHNLRLCQKVQKLKT